MSEPYDDIINLPHHVSSKHPQMPIENRAAQFSPFAALTGYDAAIKETSRTTDQRIELDESAMADLDMKLHMLTDRIADQPEISVTYFQEDEKKDGGAYVTAVNHVNKIDAFERTILLVNGEKISIDDILDIECDIFAGLF